MDGIELDEHDQDIIRRQMKSGDYTSPSDVIRAALQLLDEKIEQRESWLREEITARHDELGQHPERVISAKQVFANLEARHKARLSKDG